MSDTTTALSSLTAAQKSRQVVSFLWNLRRLAPAQAYGMIAVQTVFGVLSAAIAPLFVSKLLTEIANGTASLHSSGGLLVGYILIFFIGEVVTIRISIALAFVGETRMQIRTAERVIESQTAKSMSFHANNMSGGIVSDATKLNSCIERFWDTLAFTAVPIIATVVSVCVALTFVYWQYAVVLAILSVIVTTLIVRAQNTIAPVSRAASEKSSANTAYFADVIANISTVKAFAGGPAERTAYAAKLDEWRRANMKEMRKVLLVTGSFGSMMTLMSASAFLAAILATEHHIASIGVTYLVMSYTLNVIAQLWQVSNATRSYTRIIGDAGPMISMLSEAPELTDPEQPETLGMRRGRIVFDEVVFRHDGAGDALFDGLSLTIKPGEKVGLVGHSGSGKTTLTRLLLRFSDIQAGSITIDGQDITAVTQDDLRRRIAYVPQEPLLFHRSIRDNIAYGDPDTDMDTVRGVARMASADRFIDRLPDGYDTLVGERGVKLSGGQRQRIAIARAMLKNAPILALDEATSALDSESEAVIQDALWKLMEGRTAIVIAHRLSTIQRMDRIIVMDNGRVIEQGSHKDLLMQNGQYAQLWARQSGGFIEED